MIIDDNKVIFSTGKVMRANLGIIGISPDLSVTEGYDGVFHSPREQWMSDDDYDGLTMEEQTELADYMIATWTRFKDHAGDIEKRLHK